MKRILKRVAVPQQEPYDPRKKKAVEPPKEPNKEPAKEAAPTT